VQHYVHDLYFAVTVTISTMEDESKRSSSWPLYLVGAFFLMGALA
jgi:hypothetical protein